VASENDKTEMAVVGNIIFVKNKISLKILLVFLIAFVLKAGFFAVPVLAQTETNNGLEVEFERSPLFQVENFLPGETVQRWIKVTNHTSQSQRVAIEAINYPGFPDSDNIPEDDLSRALLVVIREKEGNDLYGGSTGEKTLFDFYQAGEIYLSDINSEATKTYEFEVIFPVEEKDEWQGKSTSFDILIGFQGTEGGISSGGGVSEGNSRSGGGGGVPPGLTITQESVIEVTENTATITWLTSYQSTSQVIYDTQSKRFDLNAGAPNYGYAYSKIGDDTNKEKVVSHQVTLTGLSPGTTYYFRCVSAASPPTISREYSFTTLQAESSVDLGQIEEEVKKENVFEQAERESRTEQANIEQVNFQAPVGLSTRKGLAVSKKEAGSGLGLSKEKIGESKETVSELSEKEGKEVFVEENKEQTKKSKGLFQGLLAGIGSLISGLRGWLIIFILIILCLLILLFFTRKSRRLRQGE